MTDGHSIFQLHVTLEDTDPPIWRRVLVPGYIHLEQLHDVLQCTMGWTDSHLHEFRIADKRYGTPMPDFDEPGDRLLSDRNAKLGDVIGGTGDRFLYVYDFGDNWRHDIVVEEVVASDAGKPKALCLAGEGCCPPEDVGGVFGYYDFLDAIADPDHEEHDEYLVWIGGDYDAGAFDLDNVNVRMTNLSGRWRGPRTKRKA